MCDIILILGFKAEALNIKNVKARAGVKKTHSAPLPSIDLHRVGVILSVVRTDDSLHVPHYTQAGL